MDRTQFTCVFKGDLRKVANPHVTETPFGTAIQAGFGNAFDDADSLEDHRDELLARLRIVKDALRDLQGWAENGAFAAAAADPTEASLVRLGKLFAKISDDAKAALAKEIHYNGETDV